MYVNCPENQNASVLDQHGMQNQQVLFSESLGYNQLNTISSGGLSVYKFQQDNDYMSSPTLTTNSERSEASSGDFCFQKRLPQMFPQLHAFQRQQHNFLNPTVQKKCHSSGQFPPIFDEMPLNDMSQGYRNWPRRNVTMFSTGLGSQQLDISLYGTSDANGRGNLGPQPPIMYQEPVNLAAMPPSGQSEKASWFSFQHKDVELSQNLVPLDPLEEKILFDMDDSSISEIASGVFGANFDSVNFLNPFPSMQSRSWLAEASSSDTCFQEEFSSLTYQNMELSTDINDISNFMDSDKQQAGCLNNNTLQGSASLNFSFPKFQLPSDQLRSCTFQDENTPDSTQRSPNIAGHWVDYNPEQKIANRNQQVQSDVSFDHLSTGNMYLQSSGMLDHPSTRADSSTSHLADMSSLDLSQNGKWLNLPGHLRKPGTFPHFIQPNDLSSMYASQMQMISPFVASQPDNATFPGVHLDTSFGSYTQQGTNVWMDPQDQESVKVPLNSTLSDVTTWQKAQHMSSTSYNMPQKAGLIQELGAAGMEHSHLNLPTSAPMWLNQIGAFKNDQTQPALDSQETLDQLTQHSKPMNKHAEIIAPKKLKLMRTNQLAWREEISKASQRDHTNSGAEQEWAKASNLLVDKAEYNFEFALPLHRSKRRLVLTSQLTQQLFDPPPSFILFSAASSSYSSLLFFVTRAILGETCSLINNRENLLPSHEVEKLTEKAKKLGESFERLLEKTIVDIRCEIADLERFSVINRFARFHSKGFSESSVAKSTPQRYITVRSIPQKLPDGVHCLSL